MPCPRAVGALMMARFGQREDDNPGLPGHLKLAASLNLGRHERETVVFQMAT
jgi:hypothetical protein